MLIALAQINTTVGDFDGNFRKILKSYAEACAHGADLVLTPELSVCGYPPKDLLERKSFIRANRSTLQRLATHTREAGLIVGYAEENSNAHGRPLFNSAAVLHRGKVRAIRRKTLLPAYDVFDEERHFEPSTENPPIKFKGKLLGLTICEDAWNDSLFWGKRRYRVDPVARQAKDGADILLNISASPFAIGKPYFRRRLLGAHARRHRLPFFYCALVGGNDELVFDGGSFALDPFGRTSCQATSFSEDLRYSDLHGKGLESSLLHPDIQDLHDALVMGIKDYFAKCRFERAVLGLSGGIDSAVTCALAVAALGPDRVTGVLLPSMYSSKGSIIDARRLAKNLGIRTITIPIKGPFAALNRSLRPAFRGSPPGLAEQNLQARIRGNILMAISNKTGALLLTTGNKSEMAVGYCTLYGDMSGGLAVIGDVYKTDIYRLAKWMNRTRAIIPNASITKPPSAELKPGQRDQDDLPPYPILDKILRLHIESGLDAEAIARKGIGATLVRDVLRRVEFAEYKRRQSPPILRVSQKAFGGGRRIPIARAFP